MRLPALRLLAPLFAVPALVVCAPSVRAQAAPAANTPPVMLDPVVTTATRVEQRGFDLPVAIDAVGRDALQQSQLRVNVSESLGAVPGLVANNRQNYAQDLQLSIRGFGARSTFGVRGVKLYQDGIPITMPDGQGQTASFALDTARAIEVLRGPFAALYGNASGGVLQVFTEDGPRTPELRGGLAAGSFGTWRANAGFGGTWGRLNGIGDVSRFATDGYREHSRAVRDAWNAKLRVTPDASSSITFVASGLDQPDSQDPLGLTAQQLAQNPRQAGTGALQFDTRKSVRHMQGGAAFETRLAPGRTLKATAYTGTRDVVQYLAFQGAGLTSAGGVVDLTREFAGVGLQYRHVTEVGGGPIAVTVGMDYDWMGEDRRGFTNENGVQGALRRDERDTVASFDQYVRAEWDFASRWQLSGGVRNARVPFRVRDRYITAQNPDDSGAVSYDAIVPVAGLLFRLTDTTNLYGAVGRGFETPTLAEFAYRPDGLPGLNLDLRAARSTNAEIGVKTLLGERGRVNVAVFSTETRDDIVAATSVAGRNTFRNADRTTREGVEVAADATLGGGWRATLAYTWLRARFDDAIAASGASLAGNRLPGVPTQWVYGALAWSHRPLGFTTTLEARGASRVYANDTNTAAAAGYAVVNWRAGFAQRFGGWRFTEFVQWNNLADKQYVGSVIVNEGNTRFYEPAPGRNWLVGLNASRSF